MTDTEVPETEPEGVDLDQLPRGTGWKRDPQTFVDAVEPVSRMLMNSKFGAAPVPRSGDHLSRRAFIRDQIDTSFCVGFSLTGAVATRLRHLGYEVDHFAPAFNYTLAVMLALAGHRRRGSDGLMSPLPDDGAFPFLGMMGGQRYGFVHEGEMPFTRAPDKKMAEPNFDDFQKASQFRLSHCRRIDLPHLRVEYAKRALHAGMPVWCGFQVGNEFQRWQAGNKPVGVEFSNLGGHMVYLTGWNDDERYFTMPNSWGRHLGDNGFWRISYDKFENTDNTSDIYEIGITDTKMSEAQKDVFDARMQTLLTKLRERGEVLV